MKKILFLAMAVLPLFIVSCAEDEDNIIDDIQEEQNVDIKLDDTSVSVYVGEEYTINVTGIGDEYFNTKITDDFVVDCFGNKDELNILGSHVGNTDIIVSCNGDSSIVNVKVLPLIDYIGPTITNFGASKSEFKEMAEEPYENYYYQSQTGTINIVYNREGYIITNEYYFDDNDKMFAVRKTIKPNTSTDAESFSNITNSMRDYTSYMENYSKRIDYSYPNMSVTGVIYSYPQKYYAVYEQTIYDYMYEIGGRLNTTNIIYYAADLDTAKEHLFIR